MVRNQDGSKSRNEKGLELYKQGKVSIGSSGLFKVSGFEVDTGRMKCECPDYKNNHRPCKHIFASLLFVKNRGKQKVKHLDSPGNSSTGSDSHSGFNRTVKSKPKDTLNKPVEAYNRDFDKQSIITRLACLNTAVEVLKTQSDSIQRDELFETARQLEQWALGEDI